MLSALLGDGKDLISAQRLIIERTEGTPFFMEEIVQASFEDGVLQRNGSVKLARSMKTVKVPPRYSRARIAYRPSARGGEGSCCRPLAVLDENSARASAARDAKTGERVGSMLRRCKPGSFILRATSDGRR